MKHLPEGFKKMGLSLLLNASALKVFEQHTLRMILRDYYVFYTKEKKVAGLVGVHLYSRPNDEACIAYHIGIYNQTMLNFQTKKKIIYANHSISKDYLKQYHINEIVSTVPPSVKNISAKAHKVETMIKSVFSIAEFTQTYYSKKENAVIFILNKTCAVCVRKKNKEGALFITNEKWSMERITEDFKLIPFQQAITKVIRIVTEINPSEYDSKFAIRFIEIISNNILEEIKKINKLNPTK